MNLTSLLPILYGLGAATTWGISDFTGGMAARRSGNALAVVLYNDWIGIASVLGILMLFGESPMSLEGWGASLLAGIVGSIGLIILYKSMAEGKMSIAASISALLSACLPVMAGIFMEGFPGLLTLIGFGLALAAVWAISAGQSDSLRPTIQGWQELKMPLLSGIGFGLYFSLIHHAGKESTLWPLIASRLSGMTILLAYAWLKHHPLRLGSSSLPWVMSNGVLDVIANGMYILASQTGRLDVAAILASLYPGMTVVLAAWLLKERINRIQAFGILAALVAIGLIAL